MVSNIDKQARQRYEIPPIKIKHPYITRTSKLQQRSELLQRSKANLEDKGRDTMRVSKSCNILKPRRTTHRHFSTTSNLQSDASSQDRSQTNNVKLGFLAPPIRASIPVKRIGMDSDRILEIKKGGVDTERKSEQWRTSEITNKRGKLNFHREESNGEKEELLVLEQFISSGFRARKNETPPNATFRKILGAVHMYRDTYTLLHAFYRSSNVSFSPTFALYRFEVESF